MNELKEAIVFGIGAKLVPEIVESVIALALGAVVMGFCWWAQSDKRR